jgi:hypothetical protein
LRVSSAGRAPCRSQAARSGRKGAKPADLVLQPTKFELVIKNR